MIIPNIWEKTPTSISISISIYTWSLEDVNFRAGPCLPMKHAPTRQDTPLFGKHAPNDIDHIYEGSSFLMNSMISPLPWFFWGISNIKLPQPPALAARATYRLGQLWQLVLGWEGGVVDGDRFIQWALDRRIFFPPHGLTIIKITAHTAHEHHDQLFLQHTYCKSGDVLTAAHVAAYLH